MEPRQSWTALLCMAQSVCHVTPFNPSRSHVGLNCRLRRFLRLRGVPLPVEKTQRIEIELRRLAALQDLDTLLSHRHRSTAPLRLRGVEHTFVFGLPDSDHAASRSGRPRQRRARSSPMRNPRRTQQQSQSSVTAPAEAWSKSRTFSGTIGAFSGIGPRRGKRVFGTGLDAIRSSSSAAFRIVPTSCVHV